MLLIREQDVQGEAHQTLSLVQLIEKLNVLKRSSNGDVGIERIIYISRIKLE